MGTNKKSQSVSSQRFNSPHDVMLSWAEKMRYNLTHGLCIRTRPDGSMCQRKGTHTIGNAAVGDMTKPIVQDAEPPWIQVPMRLCDAHYAWYVKAKDWFLHG